MCQISGRRVRGKSGALATSSHSPDIGLILTFDWIIDLWTDGAAHNNIISNHELKRLFGQAARYGTPSV